MKATLKLITVLLCITALASDASAASNFKVCVSTDEDMSDIRQIVIPPGLMFESYGRLIGALINPTPDFAWQQGDQRNDHYGVVITGQLVLTKARRCATTTALVVLSQTWGWRHSTVPLAANLFFQALEPEAYVVDLMKLPNRLGEYLAMGILNGTPTADIKDAETIP